MENAPTPKADKTRHRHLAITEPSPWVRRFAPLIAGQSVETQSILDLAAGGGRHTRHLLGLGHDVVATDRDTASLDDLKSDPNVEIIEADLENGNPVFSGSGPLAGRTFKAIVVVNYLFRPLMDEIFSALDPGGVLIYETFARGNEAFVRPRNPDHLLKSGELLKLAEGRLQVVAYEHGIVEAADIEGVKQRLCAINDLGESERDDDEPAPHKVMPS